MSSRDRLFILGASDVVWPYPAKNHWTDLLSHHYTITKFAKSGYSNIEIIQQIAHLPPFKQGDRLLVVFVSPKTPLFVWGKFTKPPHLYHTRLFEIVQDKSRIPAIKSIYNQLRSEGMFEGEDTENMFYSRMKEFLKEYRPIFTTHQWDWADSLDYIEYGKFTSFRTETSQHNMDQHLGVQGNRDFYKFILEKLDSSLSPVLHDFLNQKKQLI